jgi:hypothetical protein
MLREAQEFEDTSVRFARLLAAGWAARLTWLCVATRRLVAAPDAYEA